MARRRTTTKRRKTAARKTTTRRRAVPARRRTTRRKSTTRRKAAPKRRTTTRRRRVAKRAAPKRRRVARRKSTTRRKSPARRRVARRKSTTRRRSPAKRRKTTRRKSTTRRRSPARRRKTTRRKSTTRRRAPARRRRTARRRSVSRRRTARAMKMRMPKLGGFTNFMKKVFDVPAMGVLALGALLPTAGSYLYNKAMTMAPSSVTQYLGGQYTRPAVMIALSSGVAYMAARYNLVSNSTAVTAATLSTFLLVAGAVKGSGLLDSIPMVRDSIPGVAGMHSMAGYRGRYLGYLGNVEAAPEMLPAPVEDQLFGVGSAPSFNVF